MKAKKILAVALCGMLAVAALCLTSCGEKKELKVALNSGYAGFEVLNDDQTYSGLDIELAQMIADEMGLELKIENMEFDSVIPAVKAGTKADLGISGITITDERAKEITFSEPYYTDSQAISVQEGSEYTKENYKEVLNQPGIVIYSQLGTSGESYAKENFPNAEVKGIADISAMFAALGSGQCDAVVQNAAPSKNIVANFDNLTIIDTVVTGEEYGIAIQQGNQELIDQVNALIIKWKEDGTLEELCVKYGV